MEKDTVYQDLLEQIKSKVPERGKLVNILSDYLFLEKEAVYRRLRGEVPFTFHEISVISRKFDISLDNIIGTNSSKNRPFLMRLVEFENPTDEDISMQEHYAELLEVVKNDPNSEAGMAANLLPVSLCLSYDLIYRFRRLKWCYQFGVKSSRFKDIVIYDRLRQMNNKSIQNCRQIGHSFMILNDQAIVSLVNDINYFASIRLIDKDEVCQLKEELLRFLDDLEKLAINGHYPEGKTLDIFISSVSFETSFSYIHTNDYYLSDIWSFSLNDTISMDKQVFDKIKKWMQSLIRTSTLISGSNEVQRILFFERQRNFVQDYLS